MFDALFQVKFTALDGNIAVDFHWMGKTCLVINILLNILFYVQQKKETHTGLEQLEGK